MKNPGNADIGIAGASDESAASPKRPVLGGSAAFGRTDSDGPDQHSNVETALMEARALFGPAC